MIKSLRSIKASGTGLKVLVHSFRFPWSLIFYMNFYQLSCLVTLSSLGLANDLPQILIKTAALNFLPRIMTAPDEVCVLLSVIHRLYYKFVFFHQQTRALVETQYSKETIFFFNPECVCGLGCPKKV